MGFRQLRVINDDWVKPERIRGTPHRGWRKITCVLEGTGDGKWQWSVVTGPATCNA
jgi:hypothetical protein